MEIIQVPSKTGIEVRVQGRLDAQWADHMGRNFDEIIRRGIHHIELNAAGIDYMSSAGIRVLLIAFKRLKEIGGSFEVISPSKQVQSLLQLSGLQSLLKREAAKGAPDASDPAIAKVREEGDRIAGESALYEIFNLGERKVESRIVGHPDLLTSGGIDEKASGATAFPAGRFGLGLGAFGERYTDYRDRLGEFISAGGITACSPAGGAAPDYLIGAGDFIPEIHMVYGIMGDGAFSHLIRFEANPDPGRVGLKEIVRTCLNAVNGEAAGIVMATENAGLVGASLRLAPAKAHESEFFSHPAIRTRLTFTSERAYSDQVSFIVGFAARNPGRELAPFMRLLGKEGGISGHFHAAVLSYRPISKGRIELAPTAVRLFETEKLLGVLHLIADERDIIGLGESEFVRGACWVAALNRGKEDIR